MKEIATILLIAQLIKISILDWRTKKIKNMDILLFILFSAAYLYLDNKNILFIGLRGAQAALFFMFSFMTYGHWKKIVGAGDVKLISVAIFLLGLWKIGFVISLSLFFVGIYIMIRHPKKESLGYLPLAPFISSSILLLLKLG